MSVSGSRKSKSKKAGKGGRDLSDVDIPTVLDASIDEIDGAEGWGAVVDVLCRMFQLPDLSKRSGLKRIHANFDEIQRNLVSSYEKYIDNEKVAGGIVGIWAAMCADAILRNRLFAAGLVDRMMPLFDKRSTRYVGLQALCALTHHGGSDIRRQIARQTPTLVRLMEEFPEDSSVIELVVVVLAHVISAVVNDDDSPPSVKRRNMSVIDGPKILRLVLESAQKLDASSYLLSHALELLPAVSTPLPKNSDTTPPVATLLIACLRSKEITLRCTGMGGIFRLLSEEEGRDLGGLDPNKLMAAIRSGFPTELNDVLMAYGPNRCDVYIIMQASMDFQKAMQQCVQDHDMYALGLKLAELILRTEYSIADGYYQMMNERTGQLEIADVGLPFKLWSDSLPHCVAALRNKGTPADLDKADIVECKHLIKQQRLPAALALAKRAVARSPQIAYFQYVIGLATQDTAEGLRASKKGIKCTQTTPFVKHFLLWRATEHAANLGLVKLQNSRAGEAEYSEGIAFLTSALEDAKTFTAEASPDSRHMNAMLCWYILLTIVLRGPELSLDLKELNLPLKKLELTRKFSKFFRTPLMRTQLRVVREMVVKHYKTSFQKWRTQVERLDVSYASGEDLHRSTNHAGDNLAAWLEGLSVDDGEHDVSVTRCSHPALGVASVELYRCSFCGNPSAVLRKCSGCGKTRYCDAGCQKQHWADHKIACKKIQAAAAAAEQT